VEGQAEPLEVVEHASPQLEQHLLAEPPDQEEEHPQGDELDQRGGHQQSDDQRQRSRVAGDHRRDAAVDAHLDQVGAGHGRPVADQHHHERLDDQPAARPQHRAEQPAAARPQQDGETAGQLVGVLGGDSAPLLQRGAHEAALVSPAASSSSASCDRIER
jgi:hypothetical protein